MILVDRFLPPGIEDLSEETARRTRLLIPGALLAICMGLVAGSIHAVFGNPLRALVPFSLVAVGLLSLLWIRRGGAVGTASHAIIAAGAFIVVGSPMLGGAERPLLIGTPLIPFAAALMGGAWAGLGWTLAASTFLILWNFTIPYQGEEQGLAWLTVLSTAAIGAGSVVAERSREKSLEAKQAALTHAHRQAEQRSKAERELHEARALFEATFNRAPSLLIVASLSDGTILDVNHSFVESSGWSREEAIGKTLRELDAWASEDDRISLARLAAKGGTTGNVEIQLKTRSGKRIWLLAGAEILEVDGRGYLLAQGVDITERKRNEAELAIYREELQSGFDERGDRLRESLAELQRHAQLASVGTLASGIAHQINNPIGGIVAAAQFALIEREQGEPGETTDDALRTIVAEAQRCGQITRSILRFARNEPRAKWRNDLSSIVQGALASARRSLEDSGGIIELDLTHMPLPVFASPIDLEQVVVNLLINAAESRPGAVRIRVETRRRGGSAFLEIADDGPGFSASTRAQAFDPFFTSRVSEGGSGLGLSIVHSIVKDHDGQVDIHDVEPTGARIRVAIPLDNED